MLLVPFSLRVASYNRLQLPARRFSISWKTLSSLAAKPAYSSMEVTKDNFEQVLPQVKEAIDNADFVAIDTVSGDL